MAKITHTIVTHHNKQVEATANALILMRELVEPLKQVINKLKDLEYVDYKAWEITDIAYADAEFPLAYKFENKIKYSNEPLIYVQWDSDGYGSLHSTVFPIKWLYEPIEIHKFEQTIRENKKIAEEKAKQQKAELAEKAERELYRRLHEKYGGETSKK